MSTVEEILEHHGVKGMRWGVRKEDSSSGGMSKGQKRAVKIAAGGLLAAGALATAAILAKSGGTPIARDVAFRGAQRVGDTGPLRQVGNINAHVFKMNMADLAFAPDLSTLLNR